MWESVGDALQRSVKFLHTLLDHEARMLHDGAWIDSIEARITALCLCTLTLFFSFVHVYRHLRQFTMPQIQVYVIRIILTCPVYAVTSTLALFMGPYSAYAELLRDVYEGVVIYSFFNLILEYGGGETDCVYAIEGDGPLRLPLPLCCLKPCSRNAKLLRLCHRGVLQFVITKPIVALLDIVFLAAGVYHLPAWQITQMLVYNISYAWALYCLAVFYLAVRAVISQFRPVAKFAAVKTIIFATYYQSLILRLALSIPSTAIDWNNLMLCAEMVVFSLAMMVAFPVEEFLGGIPHRRVLRNAKEVFTFRDIVQNIRHNFSPEYHDYALQASQGEVPSTIHEEVSMTGSLSRVAKEMAQRYRGRSTKKSFNALLRGSNPITAKVRRLAGTLSNHSSDSSLLGEEIANENAFNQLHTVAECKAWDGISGEAGASTNSAKDVPESFTGALGRLQLRSLRPKAAVPLNSKPDSDPTQSLTCSLEALLSEPTDAGGEWTEYTEYCV